MSKKVIAIIGATGAQGGGLVRAILDDANSNFIPRAVTRNPDSDKAKELVQKSVEIVTADADDLESLKEAFKGAYGAFCVTNYWEYLSPEKEKKQAKNMALAAKDAGLKHVIWSTLEDSKKWIPLSDDRMPTLMEKYKVPHFDSKGESDKYFEDEGVPTTYLIASFYWENLIYFGLGPKKGPDGKLALTYPMSDKKLAGVAVEDIGKTAYGIFKAGDKYIGKRVGVAGEQLTINQMAEKLGKALGKEVVYNEVSADTFRSFGFPGADDVGNMFQFHADFQKDYLEIRNVEVCRSLNPELKNFDKWLAENKDRIPLE
jgi:uncharacterized protein YbjT (DUF2867 family)